MVFNHVAYLPHFKRRNERAERRAEKLAGDYTYGHLVAFVQPLFGPGKFIFALT
jgi:hypothetical protein